MGDVNSNLEFMAAGISLFAMGLSLPKTRVDPERRWLVGLFGLFGLLNASSLLEPNDLVAFTLESANYLLSPFLWFYVWHLCLSPDVPARRWIHFVVPVAAWTVFLNASKVDGAYEVTSFADLAVLPSSLKLILLFDLVVLPLQILTYVVIITRKLEHHRIRLREHYSDIEMRKFSWLRLLCAALLVYWAVVTVVSVVNTDTADAVLSAYGLGFVWFFAAASLHDVDIEKLRDVDLPVEKYATSPLSLDRMDSIARRITVHLETEQAYLDPQLTLTTLAADIHVKPTYLSQVLNVVFEQSFYELVNRYRITHAKELLRTSHMTVLDIAYASGFNTKSAFYNAFKEFVGQTPTSYRNSVQK